MGIVNRTPDSFFDGGAYLDERAARARVGQLVGEGADIIDIGAESTRPGAPAVSAAEQIARLGSLVAYAVGQGVTVSVDTTSPEVAEHALDQGATMINSVSLGPAAPLGRLAAAHGAALVLAHCRGSMSEMAGFGAYRDDAYGDVVADVAREWGEAARLALGAGLAPSRLVFDPGLGFTKNARQSLELCARLAEFRSLGHPILVGPGRKSFVAHAVAAELGGEPPAPADRLGGTIAAAIECAAAGADIIRVHDVGPVRQALAYLRALSRARARGTDVATLASRLPGGCGA
ncbi:MAG: dihydropteroate synthase [Deltaproteobacteria bacterium]|nr:dihydropteroate synthase [Deltaproteobacteria bacterium]